jgi:hypothetical protein
MRFMEIGEEIRYFQDYPNYPCDVVSGGRMGALMPYGADYTTRRKSRRDIAGMIVQGVPWFGRMPNDHNWNAVIRLPVENHVTTFPKAMRFKATIDRRATIRQVLWQDHALEAALWSQKMTPAGIVVTADVPEPPHHGDNDLTIQYTAPFKRHVEPKVQT